MAPNQSRQLLVWTLPTIAVLLSYFWYRRKRIGVLRDPGKTELTSKEEILEGFKETDKVLGSSVTSPLQIVSNAVEEGVQATPTRSFGRSLSGVESTPIDIIIPRELRSSRSVAVVISDEDLDFEIEKVKSMKSSNPIEEFQKARKANESIEANNNFEEVQPYNSISPATSSTAEPEISKIEMAPLDRKKLSSGNGNQPIIKRGGNQPIVKKNDDVTHSSAGPSTNKIPLKIEEVVKEEKPQSSGIKPESANIEIPKMNNGEPFPASTPVKTPVVAKGMKIDAKPFVCKNTTPTKINSVCSKSAPKKQKNKKKDTSQKNISVVEEKQNDKGAKMNNTDKNRKSKSTHEENKRQNGERDSANHSPDQAMMASHSPSSMSDNHSERSNDSGKGCSDSTATPPPPETPETPETPDTEPDLRNTHEFEIPQNLIGKLIGRRGNFVTLIHHRTGAKVVAREHPYDENMGICTVKGTVEEIEHAMQMIRGRFPLDKFPQVTLESIDILTHPVPSVPPVDHLHLKLVAGINNDTVVSCMVSPGHLFLQQPTHPTFPGLQVLTNCMNHHYSTVESPLLSPIPLNTICAAYSVDSWYRALILETDEESNSTYVKFVDYGGFAYVQNNMLRQMRLDFTLLPFQAAECFLANVIPSGGAWIDEAYNLISDLTKGCLVFAQVIEYAEDDTTPLVHCYAVHGPHKLIFLNQELVKRGFAEWVSIDDYENCGTGEIVPVESAHEV